MNTYTITFKTIIDDETAMVDVNLGFNLVKVNQHVKFSQLKASDLKKLHTSKDGDDILMKVLKEGDTPLVEFFANEYTVDMFGHEHKNMKRVDTSPVDK